MQNSQLNPYEPPAPAMDDTPPVSSNRWLLRLLAFPAAGLAFALVSLLISHNDFARLQEGLAAGFVAAVVVFFTIIARTDGKQGPEAE